MTTITIPKKSKGGEFLVAIPRSEYEEFLKIRKIVRVARPSGSEERTISRGRKEMRAGKYADWKAIKNELARRSR